MNSPKSNKYLWDANQALDRIARFTTDRSFENYRTNEMLRAAVERQFEILGEAFAGLKRTDPDTAAGIPDLARIVAFRNILIHGYASVDDRLVWGVVETDVPTLRPIILHLLAGAAGA